MKLLNKNSDYYIILKKKIVERISYHIYYHAPIYKNLIYTEIKQVNDTGLVCKKYGFFSKSGYKEIDDIYKSQLILYELKDLFSED